MTNKPCVISEWRLQIFIAALFLMTVRSFAQNTIQGPVLESDWWKIAESAPDVGEYNNPGKQNACDFTIWQAADSTWQLVACIRETTYPGSVRLFHRWETSSLTNTLLDTERDFCRITNESAHESGGRCDAGSALFPL